MLRNGIDKDYQTVLSSIGTNGRQIYSDFEVHCVLRVFFRFLECAFRGRQINISGN